MNLLTNKIKLFFFMGFCVTFFFLIAPTTVIAAPGDVPYFKNPFESLQITIPGMKRFTDARKCEDDESKLCVNWINEYIAGIYNYAIGIVGILATVVLMVGGIVWLTAGGNPTRIGEAKAYIGASLSGLIIALSSYMILYQVNPKLVGFGGLRIEIVKPKADVTTAEGDTCSKYSADPTTNKIDFATTLNTPLPSARCTDGTYTFSGYGVDEKILRAIAAVETRCGTTALESPAGACGLMQILPSTAQTYNSAATCQWLKDNPQESIKIAAQFISANSGTHNNDLTKIWVGYNAGYGTTASNGKKGAFAQSSDCPGMFAYECCINPGGLSEAQDYGILARKYYNSM
jgi:hypothetical protein